MIRNTVLKKYIDIEDVKYTISHDFSIFIPLLIRVILLLFLLITIYIVLKKYIPTESLYRGFAGIGLVLFIKYIVDFLNLYLDTLAIGRQNITLFLWDGFFNNHIEIFDWDRIETISYQQNSFWDRILMKGNIVIKLDDQIEFPFEHVYRPKKILEKLQFYKNQYVNKKLYSAQNSEKYNFEQDEKFNILIDALSEVVRDYHQKG